jgi:hypothetical protein
VTPEQAGILGRIDERTAAIKDSIERHEISINELFSKANRSEQFQSRVRGTTKGVTAGIGLVTLLATAVAKAKGLF